MKIEDLVTEKDEDMEYTCRSKCQTQDLELKGGTGKEWWYELRADNRYYFHQRLNDTPFGKNIDWEWQKAWA